MSAGKGRGFAYNLLQPGWPGYTARQSCNNLAEIYIYNSEERDKHYGEDKQYGCFS